MKFVDLGLGALGEQGARGLVSLWWLELGGTEHLPFAADAAKAVVRYACPGWGSVSLSSTWCCTKMRGCTSSLFLCLMYMLLTSEDVASLSFTSSCVCSAL